MPGFVSLFAASSLSVASLNLCTDEYLLLLARPQEIASVSRLAGDRAESPLWRSARRYPANRGTIEEMIRVRPTLLLTMGGGGRASEALAGRMGMRTLRLASPSSIAGVEANMVQVAAALGDPKRALPWRRRLAALRHSVPAPRDAIYLSVGGLSLAADGLGAEWMRLAGLAQRRLPGGRATIEQLVMEPPTVVLRSDYRAGQMSLGQRWLDHPLARRTSAAVIPTDGRRWTCAGPLLVEEIERLRRR